MSLEYNKKNIPLAKNLRKKMTEQEKKLWYLFLNKHELRFQRQKAIGNFIADFYCHKAKLVIEIDGGQHYSEEGISYDAERTKAMNGLGIKVIRITNTEVNNEFSSVCEYIEDEIRERISPSHH